MYKFQFVGLLMQAGMHIPQMKYAFFTFSLRPGLTAGTLFYTMSGTNQSFSVAEPAYGTSAEQDNRVQTPDGTAAVYACGSLLR